MWCVVFCREKRQREEMAEQEVERLKRYTEELRATVSDLSRQLHSARKSASTATDTETDASGERDRSSAKKPTLEDDEEGGGAQPRVLLLPQWPTVRNIARCGTQCVCMCAL